jgi:hypothetical protein
MKPKSGEVVVVQVLPRCDFCGKPATHDFKTVMGPWAYGCDACYGDNTEYTSLGVGKGQALITPDMVTSQ